ncbi:SusD family protein [Bacteroidales bacterium Barb7]|nr:SusD family protein [Bacteroidales bacterium Barb7]
MRHLYIIAIVFLFGGFISCTDFLEENPKGTLTDANFYKTEADAEAAVVAAYDGLNDQWNIYFRGIYLLAELPTDNAECGIGVANAQIWALDGYTHGPVNDRIQVLYQSLYQTISNANVAVDNIADIDFNQQKKERLIGEARFVRALLYFNLVRLFGGVPLELHQVSDLNNVSLAKSSVEDIYKQIIEDLKYGQQHLDEVNSSSNRGRATSIAATGLLAKVYLTIGENENARIEAKKIIDYAGTEYGLLESYYDMFTPENRYNKEFIFAVQNKGYTGTANGFALALFLPRATIPLPGGGEVNGNSADVPTEEFYNSFKSGDTRRDRTFFTQYDAGAGLVTFRPHWYKFFDPSVIANLGEGTLNYPVIRYADILLTYAEAINELNGPTPEACEAVNKVRRRAYGKDINTSDPSTDIGGLSKEQFQDIILDERRWEFGFENHRWFDLVRTGKLLTVLRAKGLNINDHNILFPFPQREIDTNKNLVQNPDYK